MKFKYILAIFKLNIKKQDTNPEWQREKSDLHGKSL